MEDEVWRVWAGAFVGFALSLGVVLTLLGMYSDKTGELGQMICDEQYGSGQTEFAGVTESIAVERGSTDRKMVVDCKQVSVRQDAFDGGITRIVS